MTESRQHLRGIARGGAIGIVGAAASAGATFLLVLIVTNTVDKSAAGQFFSGTSLFMIAVALSSLGTDAGLGRFTARHLIDGRPEAARTCWSSAMYVTTGLALVVATLAVIFAEELADAVGMVSPDAPSMLMLLAIGLPAATLAGVALSATRSLATMRPTVYIDKIFRPSAQAVLALILLMTGGGLVALGWAWSVPYLVAVALSLLFVRAAARRRLRGHSGVERKGIRREFWRFTWPRSVAQLSQMTIQRADIIIIGALVSPAAAAVYTAATRFIAFGQFGSQAIQQAIQPRFSHLIAADRPAVLADVYRTSTAWSILITWPIYLAVGAAPTIYLSLFGSGYEDEGVAVVSVMAIAMMIGVASGPVDTMLLMSGRSSLSLVNSLVALAVDLGLCFILIPRIGIVGAAIAWNAAVVVRCGLGYIQVHRSTGLTPLGRSTMTAAASATVCYGAPLGLLSVTNHLTPLLYLGTLAAGTCVYAVFLWFQRETLELTALSALVGRR